MKRCLLVFALIVGFSTFASAQQFTYYFPHIANGFYPGGSWRTSIFISNASSSTASGTITFTNSAGGAYNITFVDQSNNPAGSGNSISFQLGPGETRKFVSFPDASVTTGFATVTANAAVLGTAMFSQFDGGGRVIGEAGVPSAIPLGRQAVFVDTANGFSTGVAIANPSSAALRVTLELVNTAGQKIATEERELPPFQHFSFFIHEVFPNAPPMVGRLQFYSTNALVSIALRFEPQLGLFTTMPPFAVIGGLIVN